MAEQDAIGIISGAINLVASLIYLRAVRSGAVHSNKVTWGVWIPVTMMLAFGYYEENGFISSIWVPISQVMITLIIFSSLQIWGESGEWTWIEKSVIPAAVVVIALWVYFHSGILGMSLTLVVDMIGAVPIVVSAYKYPSGEYKLGWWLGCLGNSINLRAIPDWTYASVAYPLYLFALTLTVSVVLEIRQNKNH